MADLHLVTGYKGTAHITSADQGMFNAMTVGVGEYVFTNGRKFEAQIMSNNTVRIYDGALMMNGRFVNLESGSYLDATIANGTAGMKRHDLIFIRYTVDTTSGVESVRLVVNKGAASADSPADPAITYPNSILSGATTHDMPLYRVVLNGLTIEKVEPLFMMLAPMADIQHGFYKQNMLINGDFLCNSRGHSSYNASKKTMYTLDMWRAYKVSVQNLNEGIKLTGSSATEQGYFTQFIQLGKLKTTTYTISAMADGKVCTFTVTPGADAKEKDFGTFKISALTTSTWDNALNDYNNKLKINILPVGTNTITITYVDVFEGTVAYPHVKEDPATARLRCRRYVQAGTKLCTYLWWTKNDDGSAGYHTVLSYDPMAAAPTLEDCTAWFYTSESSYIGSTLSNITVYDTTIPVVYALNLGVKITKDMHERCLGFEMVYVLSCEPQDA